MVRYGKQLCKCLYQKGLTASGFTEQKYIAFADDIRSRIAVAAMGNTFVMVVCRYGQGFLGLILSYYITVQVFLYLDRGGNVSRSLYSLFLISCDVILHIVCCLYLIILLYGPVSCFFHPFCIRHLDISKFNGFPNVSYLSGFCVA